MPLSATSACWPARLRVVRREFRPFDGISTRLSTASGRSRIHAEPGTDDAGIFKRTVAGHVAVHEVDFLNDIGRVYGSRYTGDGKAAGFLLCVRSLSAVQRMMGMVLNPRIARIREIRPSPSSRAS